MQLQTGLWRRVMDRVMAPVSPKNLRLTAILIASYQMLIAHVLLFIVLLGLAHAEQMKTMLALDIEDQKEYGFYDLSPFPNQMRLKTASQLVSVTEVLLYILTAVSSVYLLSCFSLFAGVFKNSSQLILPWLIFEFIFIIMAVIAIFWCQNEKFVDLIGGKLQYSKPIWADFDFLQANASFTALYAPPLTSMSPECAKTCSEFWITVPYVIVAVCFTFIFFDSIIWYIMHSFYQSVRQMNKLTEIATVAIPCPPPGAIPFHFRRENMYLGSNGYKHILSEAPDGNY